MKVQRQRRGILSPSLSLYASDVFASIVIAYLIALVLAASADRFGLFGAALVLAPSLCVPFVLGGALVGLYRRETCRSAGAIAGAIVIALGSAAVVAALVALYQPDLASAGGVSDADAIMLAALLSASVWAITVVVNRWTLGEARGRDAATMRILTTRGDTTAVRQRLGREQDPDQLVVVGPPADGAAAARIDAHSLAEADVDMVVVSSAAWRQIDHVSLIGLRLAGVEVISEVEYLERRRRRVDPTTLSQYGLVFSPGLRSAALARRLQRGFDLASSLSLLLLALPMLVLTAIAVRLDSPGPILYRQTRIGFLGRPFRIIKFRSMRHDAEADGRAVWATTGDSRVTRVGRFIRKFRIDELPQLLNVLAGDMSLIGPRPERPEFDAALAKEIPFYHTRHCARPGITGWAQINYPYGASVEDARMKLEYDLYYIKHRTLALDWRILLGTVRVVLRGEGAR